MPDKKHWSNIKIYPMMDIQIGNDIKDSLFPLAIKVIIIHLLND